MCIYNYNDWNTHKNRKNNDTVVKKKKNKSQEKQKAKRKVIRAKGVPLKYNLTNEDEINKQTNQQTHIHIQQIERVRMVFVGERSFATYGTLRYNRPIQKQFRFHSSLSHAAFDVRYLFTIARFTWCLFLCFDRYLYRYTIYICIYYIYMCAQVCACALHFT